MGLVGFYSEYGYILNSEFISNDGSGGYFDDADGLNFQNSSHIKVENCYASDNGEEGFDFGGWEGDGSTRSTFDIHLRNCISTNNNGTGFSVSGTDDTQFETYHASMTKCLFKDNGFAATFLYQGARDIFIANNTFINNEYGLNMYSGSHDVTYKNNIVMNSSNNQFPVRGDNYNFNGAYNNWYPDVPPSNRRGDPYFSQNPNFNSDFTLKSSSPMINSGGPLTQTTSANSGTLVNVEESNWFTGGWNGVASGDIIMIGSEMVTVTDVPDKRTIIVDRSISWNDNEWVSFSYAGYAPDIGAYEFDPITNIREKQNKHLEFSLYQNYPNPFNPETTIQFDIAKRDQVTLRVYDILGKQIAILVDRQMNIGHHEIPFHTKNLASGIYYYHIKTGEYTETKKMILNR